MKRALCILCCLVLVLVFPWDNASAHPQQKEHYEEYEAVLFNNRKYSTSSLSAERKRNILILEYGTTLCIDQFGQAKDQGLLDDLNSWGVGGIPRNVSEINPDASQTQLASKNHRMYTHRGWDFSYETDLAHWPIRKKILISAVCKVFGNEFGNSPKGESFAALLYYIHVLGDYIEDVTDGDYKKFNGQSNGLKIPFAAAHPESTHDVFYEIKYHLGILFADQTGSRKYRALISDIDDLAGRARKIVAQTGGINSTERCLEIKPLVLELMDILTGEHDHFNYVHELLKNEPFFVRVFPW